MSTKMQERWPCPFRDGTASRKIFMALARAEKPLSAPEVARTAHVPAEKTMTLLNAYMNPYHCTPLLRVGVRLEKSADGYRLRMCKAQPSAKRPPRGDRLAKKPAKKAQRKVKKAKPTETPSVVEPIPVDAHVEPNVSEATDTDASAESAT